MNIAGANVTVPYKEKVIPYLDELSEGANIIGAINTIVCNGNTLKGYNTNAIGFMDALNDAGFEIAGKSALVFGTGGAAKAVVFMLNWLRAGAIRVAGRNPDKTAEIANRFEGKACSIDELLEQPVAADIVVNATSVSSPREAPELAARIQKPAGAGLSAGDRSELRPQSEFLAGYGPAQRYPVHGRSSGPSLSGQAHPRPVDQNTGCARGIFKRPEGNIVNPSLRCLLAARSP